MNDDAQPDGDTQAFIGDLMASRVGRRSAIKAGLGSALAAGVASAGLRPGRASAATRTSPATRASAAIRAPAGWPGAGRPGADRGEIRPGAAGGWSADLGSRPVAGEWLAKEYAAGDDGAGLSDPGGPFSRRGWVDAVVPGTVLTTLLEGGLIPLIPDPYVGLNNGRIPDAGTPGDGRTDNIAAYTYWFRVPLQVPAGAGRDGGRIFLDLRGVNYAADVFLNGTKLTESGPLTGMFLRHRVDVTSIARPGAANILAVLVTPPDPPGFPETGPFEPAGSSCQGLRSDKGIGQSVVNQVSGGWDFWQPVRDRNAGIWDRVALTVTGPLVFHTDPKITTAVTWRGPAGPASRAKVTVTACVRNTAAASLPAELRMTVGPVTARPEPPTTIAAGGTATLTATATIAGPRLWWPHGYGDPHLYPARVTLTADGAASDRFQAQIGIRETWSAKDPATGGRRFTVNRTPIFIRGGAWVAADALLRLSPQGYDDQVRLHQQANLNLIRVWGGSITERPEFYQACDRYGILVWQEFWVTGDCLNYGANPADHQLFLDCAADAVRMLRNHPSLCLWVGGNEAAPPGDLDKQLGGVIENEDGTRPYVSYSTDPSAGLGVKDPHSIFDDSNYSDGPYHILYPRQFFDGTWTPSEHRTSTGRPLPFTPETGSVGTPVAETIRAIMDPADAEAFPRVSQETWTQLNQAWNLHLWVPFFNDSSTTPDYVKDQLLLYGDPATVEEFCEQAQAAQYQQYKAMFEGRNAKMWDWYTGGVIWRSAPGWTVLRGQIYDWYLEQTGGYWGIRKAGEPLHAQLDLASYDVAVVNNTRQLSGSPLTLTMTVVDAFGHVQRVRTCTLTTPVVPVPAASARVVASLAADLDPGAFQLVKLRLAGPDGTVLSDNADWLVAAGGPQPDLGYAWLRSLPAVTVDATATSTTSHGLTTADLTLRNAGDVIAFQIRIRVTDRRTSQRITPVYATDNYLTLLPAEQAAVRLQFPAPPDGRPVITLRGWNAALPARHRDIPIS